MAQDPELIQHKEWLGFLQPVGLVVSPPALLKFQCVPSRNAVELQQTFQQYIISNSPKSQAFIADFSAFAVGILGWEPEDLIAEIPPEFTLPLPEYGETLQPNFLVFDPDTNRPSLLIQILENHQPLDEVDPAAEKSGGWNVSPQAKFERLLRETGVFVGLLSNNSQLRLVYAPRGESSGYLTFPIAAMAEVAARPILAALEMLLNSSRLFVLPIERRLTALLQESRKYQSEVSTKLAQQVLDALWELLRGFQIADAAVNGKLLGEISRTNPQHIYGGLIATLMRLVFLLYAEDEGLMPQDAVYARNYAVTGLYERLQVDAGNYPDTMDRRYGAWAWLLSLFRLVYDGGGHLPHYLPARRGQLFDPHEYPFLMGFASVENSIADVPQISDRTIFQVLNKLLILEGERLSYRSLDVEQIGSVYEAIMGFSVEVAAGVSIALRPKDVVVNLSEVLAAKASDRPKIIKELAECEIAGKSLTDLKAAKTIDDLIAALGRKISPRTPDALPACSLYLQPGEERRRSGSHYTPRSLTEPLVKVTLQPILAALGDSPTAEQILSLKVCDPAMGSGAFLVEACRQLAEELVKVWAKSGDLDAINKSEEPLIKARRLVAQRCLYGVDKNPFAVSLAKLSLWLVTLAKDYPFTFIDGALKCGDSLVGLTRREIGEFVKAAYNEAPLLALLKSSVDKAKVYRDEIEKLDDFQDEKKREIFQKAESQLHKTRLAGNVAIASFFAAQKDKERKEKRVEFSQLVNDWMSERVNIEKVASIAGSLQQQPKPIVPFNWEIEFPEVFDRANPGFDAIVGNPPFLGGSRISSNFGNEYLDWLKVVHPESHGNADLVAHFFRRAFTILRRGGCFGLIATNTIAQGDTRSTGLRYICENGGVIYHAEKRFKWPGLAAVVVSIVNVQKARCAVTQTLDSPPISIAATHPTLDGRQVPKISAFLFHAGGNDNPKVLLANAGKSFLGSKIYGQGFTFDDSDLNATPIAEMHRSIAENPKNQDRIFPYIGGEEVNSSPTHSHHRYVINFGEMSENEAREYPDLMGIVEEKVKPGRLKQNREIRARYWWRFGETTPALFKAIAKCDRVLVVSRVGQHGSFAFLPKNTVFSEGLVVFADERNSFFCIMQSRIHEIWARFLGSSMKDDLRYTPSDCFETFPFPSNWENNKELEEIGKTYYEYRAEIMVRNNQGLTATYNRFHDPEEKAADIVKLRQLHEAIDRSVLAAYGWQDIATECEFILDYEAEETEETSNKRQKKKPWRYRWPSEIHDEVLARLLELNSQRHLEETLGGKAAEGKGKTRKKKQVKNEGPMLFNIDEILQ